MTFFDLPRGNRAQTISVSQCVQQLKANLGELGVADDFPTRFFDVTVEEHRRHQGCWVAFNKDALAKSTFIAPREVSRTANGVFSGVFRSLVSLVTRLSSRGAMKATFGGRINKDF
jgi:hypothetical protein